MTLKIEAGKRYMLHNGAVTEPLAIWDGRRDATYFYDAKLRNEYGNPLFWNAQGTCTNSPLKGNWLDIQREYVEAPAKSMAPAHEYMKASQACAEMSATQAAKDADRTAAEAMAAKNRYEHVRAAALENAPTVEPNAKGGMFLMRNGGPIKLPSGSYSFDAHENKLRFFANHGGLSWDRTGKCVSPNNSPEFDLVAELPASPEYSEAAKAAVQAGVLPHIPVRGPATEAHAKWGDWKITTNHETISAQAQFVELPDGVTVYREPHVPKVVTRVFGSDRLDSFNQGFAHRKKYRITLNIVDGEPDWSSLRGETEPQKVPLPRGKLDPVDDFDDGEEL